MPSDVLMRSRSKFFKLSSALTAGTVPVVASSSPAVSNRTNVWPEMFTLWHWYWNVHPAASLDVSERCCFAIALMTELFPVPLSPKMTTFLARGGSAYILSVSFHVAQDIGAHTCWMLDFGGSGGSCSSSGSSVPLITGLWWGTGNDAPLRPWCC